MAHRLLIIAGPDEGKTFLFRGQGESLGRSRASNLCVGDPAVSRVHCHFQTEDGRLWVQDSGSHHGTFVNEQRVRRHPLRSGDLIRVGRTTLRLESEDEDKTALLSPEPPAPRARPAPAEPLHDLVGKTLATYQISRVIAKGRSGIVFQATDLEEQRPVALKVLFPEQSASEAGKRRFLRAMRTVMPLHHPNLVTVYNAGKTGEYRWVAMEYVEGKSVREIIDGLSGVAFTQKKRRWELSEGLSRGWWLPALRVGVHVARALDFAHRHQILHRNITPQNILVRTHDNTAKLGDLMLAKALEGPLATEVTLPQEILGDVEYLAPECTRRSRLADERSDIYALGAAVYALLTGRPPFVGRSAKETISMIREGEPASPKSYQPAIPQALADVVVQMLAKKPADRPPTASTLLSRLEKVAEDEGVGV